MQSTNTIDMLSDLNTSILYKVDGSVEEIEPSQDGWTWPELSELFGGFTEAIQLNKQRLMIVREEGRLKGLPVNERATVDRDWETIL